MKTTKQRRTIDLSKELRETVNSYKRKQLKMAPYLDYMNNADIVEYRRVIYTLIENLQALESIKKIILDRATNMGLFTPEPDIGIQGEEHGTYYE